MKTTPVLRARMRLAAKACTAQVGVASASNAGFNPGALAVIRIRVQPNTVGHGIKDNGLVTPLCGERRERCSSTGDLLTT
jgi:hypothetical protein